MALTWAEIVFFCSFRHIGHVGWDPNTGFDVSNLGEWLNHSIFSQIVLSISNAKNSTVNHTVDDYCDVAELWKKILKLLEMGVIFVKAS